MHYMPECEILFHQQTGQKRGAHLYRSNVWHPKPRKLQWSASLTPKEWPGICKQRRVFAQLSQKVHSDFMVALTLVLKKVFNHPDKPQHSDFCAEFFLHLAHHRVRGFFPSLHAPTRQGPEGISLRPVQQYSSIVNGYARSTQMELM